MTAALFDEAAYRQRMIDGGMDAETARVVASRQAASQATLPWEPQPLAAVPTPPEAPVAEPAAEAEPVNISGSTRKLIDTRLTIMDESPGSDDMTFMHSIMCQIGLPRSKVNDLEFERVCGAAGLYIRAGKLWDGKQFVQQMVPYGPMPRLIMAFMNTQALRNKTPEIEVGQSASDMLRKLGTEATGGKNGSLTMFRNQTKALAACSMTIGFAQNDRAYTYDGKPIRQFEAWITQEEGQPALWPGVITLSDEYYKTLREHAVPLDLRALMGLKGSALAMDIYTWLAERLHRIGPRPVILHWKSLREQFGQEFNGKDADKDFKKKFLPAFKKVLAVYPEAKAKQVTGGMMLMASPPPIPYKPY